MAAREPVSWTTPPQTPELKPGEVHVWEVPARANRGRHSTLIDCLTEDEKREGRAAWSEAHGETRLITRAILRMLLGAYLNDDPARVPLTRDAFGKPVLAHGPRIHFNVSHAAGRALLAFAHGRCLGVDLEPLRPDRSVDKLARRFFSPREHAGIMALPKTLRPWAFAQCWTYKEARAKASGQGVRQALNQAAVCAILPEGHVEPLRDPAAPWSLIPLVPTGEYAAALAVPGAAPFVQRCWKWRN